MSQFKSGFSKLIGLFIEYRMASGSWNEPCYGLNIKLFDHFCADNYQSSTVLTQEMVDTWCSKRDTETNRSYERELPGIFPLKRSYMKPARHIAWWNDKPIYSWL
jgi:hypothetical protein